MAEMFCLIVFCLSQGQRSGATDGSLRFRGEILMLHDCLIGHEPSYLVTDSIKNFEVGIDKALGTLRFGRGMSDSLSMFLAHREGRQWERLFFF